MPTPAPAPIRTTSPPTRHRLLIVDDEPANIEIVARTFRTTFEVHHARDGEEALAVARKVRPDVIITDQRMPKLSGVEFLTQLKNELPHAIRVLVTSYADYEALVDAVNEADVHHYIEKPFHAVNLRAVVDSLLHTAKLKLERETLVDHLQRANDELLIHQTRLEEARVAARTQNLVDANQRLKELAVRDGLTNLFNHRYFVEHLEIELARSHRYKRVFSVIFVDVDDFKPINDTHGHAAGDQVLCRIADLLRPEHHGLRNSDFAARYGGEEFCVVLPETPLAGGELKANRLRQSIESYDWRSVIPTLERPITVSIGVAVYPDHGVTVEALVAAADRALYDAKHSGKNRVRVVRDVTGETEASS